MHGDLLLLFLYTFLAGCLVVDNFKFLPTQYNSIFTKSETDKNILTIHTLTERNLKAVCFISDIQCSFGRPSDCN